MFIEIPANKKSLWMRRPIYGMGINDATYQTKTKVEGKSACCPFYLRWKSILARCYSSLYQEKFPSYVGCSICDEWLVFSVFKEWMSTKEWKGKHLDKDILFQGNKIYSPDTCVFVDSKVNLLIGAVKKKSDLPTGVSKHSTNRFMSHCRSDIGNIYLGCFKDANTAHEAYKKFKYAIIKEVALKQLEPLRSALLNYEIR